MEKKPMNNRSVIRRIRKIEDMIVLKPREDLVVVWSFGSDDEPHGKYGYRKFHVYTGLKEACTEEEEQEFLLEAYERIPLKARKNVKYWSSFQNFLEYHRCKCPLHIADEDPNAVKIQNMLREYEEVLEKVAKRSIEAREREILNRKS
jgi:hypothetical protein